MDMLGSALLFVWLIIAIYFCYQSTQALANYIKNFFDPDQESTNQFDFSYEASMGLTAVVCLILTIVAFMHAIYFVNCLRG